MDFPSAGSAEQRRRVRVAGSPISVGIYIRKFLRDSRMVMHRSHLQTFHGLPDAVTVVAAVVPTAQLRWSARDSATAGCRQCRLHGVSLSCRRGLLAVFHPPSGSMRFANARQRCQPPAAEQSDRSERSEQSQELDVQPQLDKARLRFCFSVEISLGTSCAAP